MNNYEIIKPVSRGSFRERLAELYMRVGDFLDVEHLHDRQLRYAKVFLSDAQNQYDELMKSDLYNDQLSHAAPTIVEQAPADGSKITVLLMTGDSDENMSFLPLRLTEKETRGCNSYLQTMSLFEKYLDWAGKNGVDMKTHLVRTWIYVADIDNNYEGVVKARNDIFKQYGLTTDTHYIASTGIGGHTEVRSESVAMDFLTFPDIKEEDKKYLNALDHLDKTHDYGVAFERGTRLKHDGLYTYYISGTASIDNKGDVLYPGDVERQTGRLLENIGALLKDGDAKMNDIRYFIIYLRDSSDFMKVERIMNAAYPTIPHVILHAKVCRPQWLIEMECIAEK